MAYEKQESENKYWNPKKEGDQVEGLLTEITLGDYGNHYHLNVDGEEIITSSHKVLQSLMAKAEKGDKVKIVYLKEEAPKKRGDNPTKMYEVYIDRHN